MKNQIMFSILIIILLTSDAFPQYSKCRFGIFSGVSVNTNSYNISGKSNYLDTSYSNTSKAAFSIGMFAMYDFVRSFSVKLQGHYTIKGGISSATLTTYSNSISYMQLSLLPQFNLPLFKDDYNNKAYFNAGGYLSFVNVLIYQILNYPEKAMKK